jgi:hypothetical protein
MRQGNLSHSRRALNPIDWGIALAAMLLLLVSVSVKSALAQVKPGDFITPDNASKVKDLVTPGQYPRILNGMTIKVVAPVRIDWPPPYQEATEKYASQVRLSPDRQSLVGYVAGEPFPAIDTNDRDAGVKVMWNEVFRPISTDDYDLRYYDCDSVNWGRNKPHFSIYDVAVGHYSGYNEVGRTEVDPIPTDPDFLKTGRLYMTFNGPVLSPATDRGALELKFRYSDPKRSDDIWSWTPGARRLRRLNYQMSDTASGPNIYDPNHWEGWSGKNQFYDFKFLGEKMMLGAVNVSQVPDRRCPTDGGASHCPDEWALRHYYIVQATARFAQSLYSKEIIYVDSEADFPMAVDLYDRNGQLFLNYTSWMAYSDRPEPGARIAIYPFKREFQVGSSTVNLQTGFSSVCYHPSRDEEAHDSWFINMGAVQRDWFLPEQVAASAEGGRWVTGN